MPGDSSYKPPAFVSSYHTKIRPILDAVDKLRLLKVTREGINLPTIVVIGEQSSGKSSLLESLAGISLPRREGICTRVPLIMRLQHHDDPMPEFFLQFQDRNIKIGDESQISNAIELATDELAGAGKAISNIPITLWVKKRSLPDITMVDLPGLTRVAVGNQPRDVYQQITALVSEYIKPVESILLNVVSSADDFSTSDSLSRSQEVDREGLRTLVVITKCDLHPKIVARKLSRNLVKLSLGFFCVRNRNEEETCEEARERESQLFATDPDLSKLDKARLGIPSLADRLVQLQYRTILNCLPMISRKINDRLDDMTSELVKLPGKITSIPDATAVLMQIVASVRDVLEKIVIRGEYDMYKDDREMHGDARLIEMVNEFFTQLHSAVSFSEGFLVEEIKILEEADGIRLPQFLRHSALLLLLQERVNKISQLPHSFINKAWNHLETIFFRVLADHCRNYPQLFESMKMAAVSVLAKMKEKMKERVTEMIEMEAVTDYTCDPNFSASLKELMGSHDQIMDAIQSRKASIRDSSVMTLESAFGMVNIPSYKDKPLEIELEGYGVIGIKHLVNVTDSLMEQAFDLKMRVTAYWEVVLKRLVDWITLHLRFTIRKTVKVELQQAILNEVTTTEGGLEGMMAEASSIAARRKELHNSIKVLEESKKVLAKAVADGNLPTHLVNDS